MTFTMGGDAPKRKKKKSKALAKDFGQITAPIGGMIKDLDNYEEAQKVNEADLEVEKAVIEEEITVSKGEQNMSSAMSEKLKALTDPTKKLLFADIDAKPEEADEPIDLTDKVEDDK